MCIVFLVRSGSKTLILFPFATITESYKYQNSLQIRTLILRTAKVSCIIFSTSLSSTLWISVFIVDFEQVNVGRLHKQEFYESVAHDWRYSVVFIADFEQVLHSCWFWTCTCRLDVNANYKKINWGLSSNFASYIKRI